MSLTKEQFLAKRERVIKPVELPSFGGCVYVRKLTVSEQTKYEAELSVLDRNDTDGYTAIMLAFWLCTETGENFLTVNEAREHVAHLEAPEVAAVLKAGGDINQGIAPKAVEDLAKN